MRTDRWKIARTEKRFYVYALFLEDGQTPFYIGKGTRRRIHQHETVVVNGRRSKNPELDDTIRRVLTVVPSLPRIKVAEGLTDFEALKLEIDLIALIGRSPNGPLVNRTAGGEGGTARFITDEARIRLKEACKKRGISPETIKKMIASPTRGRKGPHTAETRAKMSAAKIGHRVSQETREKFRAALIGRKQPAHVVERRAAALRGRDCSTPATRDRIGAMWRGRSLPDDLKKKMSDAAKRRWAHPEERDKQRLRRLAFSELQP